MSPSDDERFGAELTAANPALQRRALALTRKAQDASDLVQETLLKAWAARDRFEPGTHLLAWLTCIMRNTFLSQIRKGAKEVASGLGDYAAGQISPPSQEWALVARRVREALGDLPPEQAQAILQIGVMGGSYVEAADRFGCVAGTIKSRVCRGRQELRRRCGAEDIFAHTARAGAMGG